MSKVHLGLVVTSLILAGCLASPPAEDEAPPAPTDALVPVRAVSGITRVANLPAISTNDLAFKPGFVFASSAASGMRVYNVSDPAKPQEVSIVPCRGVDVGVVDLPNGRRIVTISNQGHDGCPNSSPQGGIRLVDVTQADNPKVLGQVALPAGSHTNSPWGDSGLVFNSQAGQNSPQGLPEHRVQILNISSPDQPKIEAYFTFPATSSALGCHDITMDLARNRAFCSAASETQIWDMSQPTAPKVIATILNPKMQVHHWAATSINGTLLVLGDESGGFIGPACSPGQPLGALWAYDIADPTKPVEKGYFVPPRGAGPFLCTAHYFNFIGDGPILVGAFYTAGTVVVDFTNPAAPKLVDQEVPAQTNAWSSYWNEYDDHVYVGDVHRGLDVFRLDPT